jgi:hypothetical protein
MKSLYLLCIIAFVCQSCYSYKNVGNDAGNLIVGRKYKISLKDKCVKANFVSANDSVLTVMRHQKKGEIRRSEIEKIEGKKFSLWKTIAYPVIIIVVIVGGAAVLYSL